MNYNNIVSLFIKDKNNPKKVLLVVRNPETNTTHPNVISTPTARIPRGLASGLFKGVKFNKTSLNIDFPDSIDRILLAKRNRPAFYSGKEEELHDPLVYVVATTMLQKICTPTQFEARVGSIIEGEIFYEDTGIEMKMTRAIKEGVNGYSEKARMIGIEVLADKASLFPSSTASYSKIRWVNEEDFKKMVTQRDILSVSPSFGKDSVMYCVKGFCLLSAYAQTVNK
jgi:hypothetical protein